MQSFSNRLSHKFSAFFLSFEKSLHFRAAKRVPYAFVSNQLCHSATRLTFIRLTDEREMCVGFSNEKIVLSVIGLRVTEIKMLKNWICGIWIHATHSRWIAIVESRVIVIAITFRFICCCEALGFVFSFDEVQRILSSGQVVNYAICTAVPLLQSEWIMTRRLVFCWLTVWNV